MKIWAEEVQMYEARCQSMDARTLRFQHLLINKLLEDVLAREVDLRAVTSFYMVTKRVTNTFKSIYLMFERKPCPAPPQDHTHPRPCHGPLCWPSGWSCPTSR